LCREARLCLYGPPGSGKSGFAYHLARQLDIPLIVKKGSDILGRYLGESEQNLANAFNEAQSKSGLLLIDEVDSLLSDRSGAQRNWEVSLVNELLTQIDIFKGILIVTTNFLSHLDSASMRRFDLKVKFDYLKPEQVLCLWKKYSDDMLLSVVDLDVETVQKMSTLTPGDFANIKRQSKFLPVVSSSDFLSRLQREVGLKNQSLNKGIGFLTCQV
jgi:SpoVK/Ycf46/Vps4 family AAA+-type ATPase